jgi:hypothetical protein
VSGQTAACALPPDGLDLRAELAAHQRALVEQALAQAGGDLGLAAKLLRVTPLELTRLNAGASALTPYPVAKQTRSPKEERDADMSRIDRGVELISRAAIRRLHAEGRTPRQIAQRLGVNPFVIEKVLRAEAELAKCAPTPPERQA